MNPFVLSINNGSECYVVWSCNDINGNPYTPSSLSYQVWDLTNDREVVSSTPITPTQTGTITLNATVNTMLLTSGAIERRQVTLKVGIPGGTFRNDVATYNILQQAGTP